MEWRAHKLTHLFQQLFFLGNKDLSDYLDRVV